MEDAPNTKAQRIAAMKQVIDQHSFARPDEARITHLDWKARVDFDTRTISGTATYDISVAEGAERIIFDTHDLDIQEVLVDGTPVDFPPLGASQPFIGRPLTLPLSDGAKQVSIRYTSSPVSYTHLTLPTILRV